MAHRVAVATQEGLLTSTRKEVRLKQVGEIAELQSRCQGMREEMTRYKLKQEELLAKLNLEREREREEFGRIKFSSGY
jgi:hypothetical protein